MATAYVLGTFDDPLEALHDFEGHAILVLLTGAEQDVDTILDRDTTCGINDEVPIFFPPQITAKAWLEAEATALLHVHCANPLDCPELDRVPIRSHGCNPPPNCIAEPDALTALVANPTCAEPTFLPPSSPRTKLTRNLNFGYATASAVAYDMSFENTTSLVNYIEIPFQQRILGRLVGTVVQYTATFRGIVRLYDSGTVYFIGEASTTSPSDFNYRVHVGPDRSTGSYVTIKTIPTGGAWHSVDFSLKPAVGSFVFCVFETVTGISNLQHVQLWEYPTGWKFPIEGRAFGSAGGYIEVVVNRSGNNVTMGAGSYSAGSSTGADIILFSYELDSSTWASANFTSHLNFAAPVATGGNYVQKTDAIPDSSTIGIRVDHRIAQSGNNVTWSTGDFGPIFREAYDPVVQQGVDPIP